MITNNTLITFIDDLIDFLDSKFEADPKIEGAIKGKSAFNTNLIREATQTFYVVRCISNAPRDETFVDVATLDLSVQIDIYALKGTYDGVEYLAEPMSMVLQNVVSNYMYELKYNNINPNICLMREITSSPSLPFENGSKAYQASLRYQFAIMRNYKTKGD